MFLLDTNPAGSAGAAGEVIGNVAVSTAHPRRTGSRPGQLPAHPKSVGPVPNAEGPFD